MFFNKLSKVSLLVLVLLVNNLFSAVISTTSGKINAQVISIDKTGVVIKARLGTTVLKPADVKWILFDESRTDLEGKEGILLSNGLWIYGEPNQITTAGGTILGPYVSITTNLDNIVYFSFSKNTYIENLLNYTVTSDAKFIVPSLSEETIVMLINDCSLKVDKIERLEDGNRTIYKMSDSVGTYLIGSNYISVIMLGNTVAKDFNFVVDTKEGEKFLCNVKFNGDNVILYMPFNQTKVFKISQIAKISKKEIFEQNFSFKDELRINDITYPAEFEYNYETKTLTVKIVTDTLKLADKKVDEIVIINPNK